LAQGNPIFWHFSPSNTLAALGRLLSSGALLEHTLASLQRVGVGMAWAVAIGFAVGLAVGLIAPLERSCSVLFQFLRMTSPISWMPLAVMVLGIGNPPIYFLLIIAALWPVLFSTAAAAQALDRRWQAVARSLGATPFERLWRVIVPAILPQFFTGVRLALGLVWVVLVPAEMLGVRSGLGYLILDARDRLAYGEVMALIMVIGLIGYLLDALLRLLQQHFSWSVNR
jgi:NitT/TauT family transport system permease protein